MRWIVVVALLTGCAPPKAEPESGRVVLWNSNGAKAYVVFTTNTLWPRAEMDNYSFCVGVYCAERVLQMEATNHDEVLHQARIYAVTNGWPRFNNRDGFRKDVPW